MEGQHHDTEGRGDYARKQAPPEGVGQVIFDAEQAATRHESKPIELSRDDNSLKIDSQTKMAKNAQEFGSAGFARGQEVAYSDLTAKEAADDSALTAAHSKAMEAARQKIRSPGARTSSEDSLATLGAKIASAPATKSRWERLKEFFDLPR